MKMLKLIEDALKHEALWDLVDSVVVSRLKDSRDSLATDLDHLKEIKSQRLLEPYEEEDCECYVKDIQALDRVIDLYGGNLNA